MHDFPSPAPGSDHLIATFNKGSALVAASLAALEAMAPILADLDIQLASLPPRGLPASVARLYRLVQDAAVGAENLLVAPLEPAEAFTLRVVGRQPSGAVDVRTLEIDRDALAMVGRDDKCDPRALDRFADAARLSGNASAPSTLIAASAALDHLRSRVAVGASRLSLVKARLDLQESFLASVLAADPGAPRARIESHLDQASARDMAQAARRLLTARSLTIAAGNKAVLASLLLADPTAG